MSDFENYNRESLLDLVYDLRIDLKFILDAQGDSGVNMTEEFLSKCDEIRKRSNL